MNPCPACGTLNVSGTIACMRCGTPLASVGGTESPAVDPAQGGSAPPATETPAPTPEPAPSAGAGWGTPPPSDGYSGAAGGGPYAAPIGAAPGAPKRPLDVGEAIKGAFDVCSSNFKVFFVIELICAAPGWLVQTVGQVLQSYSTASAMSADGGSANPGIVMAGGAVAFLGMLIYLVGGVIAAAAVSRGALDAMARRTVGDSSTLISYGVGRLGSTLLGVFLTFLATLAGTFLCCVPGILAAIVFVMTVPVIVAEGANSTNAMQRSFDLSEGSRVEIFLTLLVYGAIAFVIMIPIMCVTAGVGAAASVGVGAAIGGALASQVMSLLIGAATGMLSTALYVAIYVKLSGYGAQTNSAEVAKVFA